MNGWLMQTAAAALGLFVFLKIVRFFCKPPPKPEKTEQKPPPGEDALARRARDLFLRVQKAWDARDLEALGLLVTPGALEELEAQIATDTGSPVTEILHVSAGIVSRLEGEDASTIKVLFDVIFCEKKAADTASSLPPQTSCASSGKGEKTASSGKGEDAVPSGDEPVRIRELWHIVTADGEWRVDAIRQIK